MVPRKKGTNPFIIYHQVQENKKYVVWYEQEDKVLFQFYNDKHNELKKIGKRCWTQCAQNVNKFFKIKKWSNNKLITKRALQSKMEFCEKEINGSKGTWMTNSKWLFNKINDILDSFQKSYRTHQSSYALFFCLHSLDHFILFIYIHIFYTLSQMSSLAFFYFIAFAIIKL